MSNLREFVEAALSRGDKAVHHASGVTIERGWRKSSPVVVKHSNGSTIHCLSLDSALWFAAQFGAK